MEKGERETSLFFFVVLYGAKAKSTTFSSLLLGLVKMIKMDEKKDDQKNKKKAKKKEEEAHFDRTKKLPKIIIGFVLTIVGKSEERKVVVDRRNGRERERDYT